MPAPSVPVEPKPRRWAEVAVVALVALRLWARRDLGRQERQSRPLVDDCRFVPEPKHRGRVIVSMLVAAAGALGAGIWKFPPTDVEPDNLAAFELGFPILVNDGHSVIALGRVSWFEPHGEGAELPQDVGPSGVSLPDVVPGTVRAVFRTEWYAPVGHDVPITLSITLPPGAKLAKCYGPEVQCLPVHQPGSAPAGFAQGDCIKIRVPIREGHLEAAAAVDIAGSNGLAVTTNRTRARVQYPTLIPNWEEEDVAKLQGLGPGFAAQVAAVLPDAAGYAWTPEAARGPVDNMVAWQMAIPMGPNAAAPAEGWRVAGVRNAVLRRDDQLRFAAGIAFGVGGSALIVVIQTVVEAFPFARLTGLRGRVRRRCR